jgi:hypothetical protein
MIAQSIPLQFAGTGRIARLRELTGRDEYGVSGSNTANAIRLLAALMDESEGVGKESVRAVDLVAADRDRLLAAVYNIAFGDRIESTLTCSRCEQPFDLDFSLSSLVESVNQRTVAGEWRVIDGGTFEGIDGIRFRLPTGGDELAVADLPSDQVESRLLQRCVEGSRPADQDEFERLLENVAPLLDLQLVAACPECENVQTVQFDIQSYLLGALTGERSRLLAEVHRIARAYSWSLDEILALKRSDRRRLVELIENDHVT